MIKMFLSISSSILLLLAACGNVPSESNKDSEDVTKKVQRADLTSLSKAYFASGCFWCVEAIFEDVKGVTEVISGYAGGEEKNPTYEQVSAGLTSHAEAVEIYYNPEKVEFETLVKVFFGSHDPTTLNQQGPDKGAQYRSIAFYTNENEEQIINDYIKKLKVNQVYEDEITTEVKKLNIFYDAEDYHQDYEKKNPNNPYVQRVSIPRLRRFQEKYPELLKGH
jgi:peptide-methionine (S)-S-oxide reductase